MILEVLVNKKVAAHVRVGFYAMHWTLNNCVVLDVSILKDQTKKEEGEASTSLAVWGITFSGLVCVGDKISRTCINNLQPNSHVIKLHQHFFVFNDCLSNRIEQTKFVEVPFMTVDSCKASYDKSTLSRLAGILRALKQSSCSNSRIKRDIAGRGLEPGQGVQHR